MVVVQLVVASSAVRLAAGIAVDIVAGIAGMFVGKPAASGMPPGMAVVEAGIVDTVVAVEAEMCMSVGIRSGTVGRLAVSLTPDHCFRLSCRQQPRSCASCSSTCCRTMLGSIF